MGKALRRRSADGRERGRAVGREGQRVAGSGVVFAFRLAVALCALPSALYPQAAPSRLDRGRFTAVYYPGDAQLASSLLDRAIATDTFPGLPRPAQRVLMAIAPDQRRFREWVGPDAPEWGAAIAFPDSRRIVMQGHTANSDAGDPYEVLRHELAHLALHEYLGDLPPRWFDEGYASYAARELSRNDVLAANYALALRGMPSFDELDDRFTEGTTSAQAAYALAYRAVDDMAQLDPSRGLSLLLRNWKAMGSLDRAMRASFGVTLSAFQHDWQQRTRRRYGGLALLSDLTLATVVLLLIISPLYLARRRRDRKRMAALAAADVADATSQLDELLDPEAGTDGSGTSRE